MDCTPFDQAAARLREIIEGTLEVGETELAFALNNETSGNLIVFATGHAADTIRALMGVARTAEGMRKKVDIRRSVQQN